MAKFQMGTWLHSTGPVGGFSNSGANLTLLGLVGLDYVIQFVCTFIIGARKKTFPHTKLGASNHTVNLNQY